MPDICLLVEALRMLTPTLLAAADGEVGSN
jgi:hypothetical protein